MKKFKYIMELVESFDNGNIDFQDSKKSDFTVVAEENGKRFYQRFILQEKKCSDCIKIGRAFFLPKEKTFT